MRLGNLNTPTIFRHAVFVAPGYSSLLFAHLYEANSCPQPTSLFRGFRRWMYRYCGLQLPQESSIEQAKQVTVLMAFT